MTPKEFKDLRLGLMLTQQNLADVLGYRHKVRISEFERDKNPVPIPSHIEEAMQELRRIGKCEHVTRKWQPDFFSDVSMRDPIDIAAQQLTVFLTIASEVSTSESQGLFWCSGESDDGEPPFPTMICARTLVRIITAHPEFMALLNDIANEKED